MTEESNLQELTSQETDWSDNGSHPAPPTLLTTLMRGLRALEVIADSHGNATAKTVRDELGLKISTIYHLLRTLRATGHVVRLQGGFYDVGSEGLLLGKTLQASAASPAEILMLLTRLHNKTHETAYISGWHHGTVLLKQFIASKDSFTCSNLSVGYTYHMHARASCRAVLAFLPESDIERIFQGVALQRLTPNTIIEYDELLVDLAKIRSRGYVIEREQFQMGAACISAPFFDENHQPQGSFTVSVPLVRLDRAGTSLVHAVRESAILATNYYRGVAS